LQKLDHPQEAIHNYNKAISIEPCAEYYYQKSNILYNLHQYEESLEFINKALSISKDKAEY